MGLPVVDSLFTRSELEISKKMVKVAEIVIRKRRVTEKKKIDIDIIREEVAIKHHSGQIEKL